MDTYRVSTVDVPESPIVSGTRDPWQQRCDSLYCYEEWWCSVPPSIVIFSLNTWAKVVQQEHAVVGSVYRPPWRYRMVQYYSITIMRDNEHHLRSTLCRAHFLWTRRSGMLPFTWLPFQVWFVWATPDFVHSIGGSPGELSEELVTQEKRKKVCRMNCDVGEATEGLENELWRRWSDGRVGE